MYGCLTVFLTLYQVTKVILFWFPWCCTIQMALDREVLVEECKIGWLTVEKDFRNRLLRPEQLKHGEFFIC